LGFQEDERDYEIVNYILDYFDIKKIHLLTNNPKKIESLSGIEIVKRWPIIMASNKFNEDYLKTKKELMGHMI
jgi:GTP cyclohydrolase II